jgi:hypothetical protein
MFTRSDLSDLLAADPPLAVSVFLPTQTHGPDVRQGPIRLKNLTTEAARQLLATGMASGEVEEILAPAKRLAEDHSFWQHQSHGLSLFLDTTGARHHQVPIPLDEQVVVGPGFHVRPLLPVLAADGRFIVLTVTADQARLYHGSRFALVEDESADVLRSSADVTGEPDYENPVQAAPVARPGTGTINIGNAQVYGDSPPEWHKTRLVKFTQQLASDVESLVGASRVPVVLVADVEVGGHFRRASTLGAQLVGAVETNPRALDESELHGAAYSLVAPVLDQGRLDAVDRLTALLGQGDRRVALDLGDVVRGAHRGQVEVLLLDETDVAWGHYDPGSDELVLDDCYADRGQDLLESAAVHTLRNGGAVHVLGGDEMPDALPVAAVLRY